MKTDFATKVLLVFVGSGMWALALTHWQAPIVTAQVQQDTLPVQSVVRTQRLEVVDSDGKVRASFAALGDFCTLSIDDESGKHRLGLSAGKYGSALSLLDENGKTRALLSVLQQTPTTLRLKDEKGKTVFEEPRPAATGTNPNPFHEYR